MIGIPVAVRSETNINNTVGQDQTDTVYLSSRVESNFSSDVSIACACERIDDLHRAIRLFGSCTQVDGVQELMEARRGICVFLVGYRVVKGMVVLDARRSAHDLGNKIHRIGRFVDYRGTYQSDIA